MKNYLKEKKFGKFLLSWVAPGRERGKKNLFLIFSVSVLLSSGGSGGGWEIWQMDTCCMFCFQIANCRERMETTLKAGYLQSYFSCVGMDSYDERVFFKMFWPRSHWPLSSYIRGSSGSGPTSVCVCETRNPQYVDVGIELWWQLTGNKALASMV